MGQQKLYYGLATCTNGMGSAEVSMPRTGSPYVSVSGLTGRSLQRVRLLPNRQRAASNYGRNGSELEWAGDVRHRVRYRRRRQSSERTKPRTSPPPRVRRRRSTTTTATVHFPLHLPLLLLKQPLPQAKSLADDIPLDPGVGGQSIGIQALQVGDVILSTTDHLTSSVIRAGSGSQVSHAMLFVGQGGQVVEAVGGGVRLVPLEDAINDSTVAVAFRVAELSDDQRQQIADKHCAVHRTAIRLCRRGAAGSLPNSQKTVRDPA